MKAKQNGEVRLSDGKRIGKVELSGTYFKDYTLKYSPGYAVYLKQNGTGKIDGLYNQLQFGNNDLLYSNSVSREYTYDTKREIPFDEIMIFKVIGQEFRKNVNGQRTNYVSQTTYYAPSDYRDYCKYVKTYLQDYQKA
jgi:hypothetical protein